MRLLLTNDDGIESEGIHVLAATMVARGHDVVVVAPDRDWSGASAAVGSIRPDEQIDVRRVDLPGCPEAEAWALDGPPALAVFAARLGGFGERPDLVVSGINAGLNTGRAVLHSGTVGAVLTGQNLGWSGLAVSIQPSEPWYWQTAATLAADALELVIDAPARSVLNLNVPARPLEDVKGMRWARMATFGEVRAAMDGPQDGRLQFRFEAPDEEEHPDSDSALVRSGHATLTALVGVAEAWPAEEGLDASQDMSVSEGLVPGAPLHEVHRLPGAGGAVTLRNPSLG
jgi:5'-nucleotidase